MPGGTLDAQAGLPASDPTAAFDASGTAGSAGTAPTAEVGAVAPGASGPLNVGQSFGPRDHIIRILGVGEMGAVYQAWDSELGVAVALKVIRADRRRGSALPAAEKRFKNELLLARQVTHKNVVRIHDLGEMDGIKFITMPYVEGDDLATILRREEKLPIARALHVAREVACGLEAAHEAGVVHRDLKPANIMIGSGEEQHALIMDFGISASATPPPTAGLSARSSTCRRSRGSAAPSIRVARDTCCVQTVTRASPSPDRPGSRAARGCSKPLRSPPPQLQPATHM